MYCGHSESKVGCLGLKHPVAVNTEGHKVVSAELSCMQVNSPRCISHLTYRAGEVPQIVHKMKYKNRGI